MALVWFVDKSPRSRKPIQFMPMDDLVFAPQFVDPQTQQQYFNTSNPWDDQFRVYIPVILPCPVCTANQQLTSNSIAHRLLKNRTSSMKSSQSEEEFNYERIVESPEGRLANSRGVRSGNSRFGRSRSLPVRRVRGDREKSFDEFLLLFDHVQCLVDSSLQNLSLKNLQSRICTRKTCQFNKKGQEERYSQNHYAWMKPDLSRYRSRFNPMRIHDVIRDDMAFRMWRPEMKDLVRKSIRASSSLDCSAGLGSRSGLKILGVAPNDLQDQDSLLRPVPRPTSTSAAHTVTPRRPSSASHTVIPRHPSFGPRTVSPHCPASGEMKTLHTSLVGGRVIGLGRLGHKLEVRPHSR